MSSDKPRPKSSRPGDPLWSEDACEGCGGTQTVHCRICRRSSLCPTCDLKDHGKGKCGD